MLWLTQEERVTSVICGGQGHPSRALQHVWCTAVLTYRKDS
jgi:hypothetical protein